MRCTINQNWLFAYGERNGTERQNKFEGFSPIGLPHTFQLPYYGDSSFYVGYGVYGKKLILSDADAAQQVSLEFLGVFQEMELFVNGQTAGKHRGGYTSFVCEITPYVQAGENTIVVRANNLWRSDLPPRAGEHTFCGGIYRDVSLLIEPKQHIAWKGLFVKTPEVSADRAVIEVTTEICDGAGLVLHTSILDPEGHEVGQMECVVASETAVQICRVETPKLWHPDHPCLYTAVSRLGDHQVETKFGVRSLRFTAKEGFFLNGAHYLLEGANVHQDRGGWGDACTRSGITRDLLLLKEAGFNMVRGSHYPKHPFFAEECDRLGLLFWSELPFWGIGGFKDEGFWNASAMPTNPADLDSFEQNCRRALEEMIHMSRNSPSVITWSMGNEIFFSKKSVLPQARALVQRLAEYSKELDDTRPASVGGTQRGDFHAIGDLTGFNGDGAVLFQKPELPSMVAEYGSVQAQRPGKYRTHFTDGVEKTYPWRSGRALWCAFHHGSIANIGDMGIIDLYRIPLRAYYAYRELLKGTMPPVFPKQGKAAALHLACDRSEMTCDGTQDCRITVTLADETGNPVVETRKVVLEVTEGAGLFPTGSTWVMGAKNGTFLDGTGAIELRACQTGVVRVQASSEGLDTVSCSVAVTGDKAQDGRMTAYPRCPVSTSVVVAGSVDLLLNRPVKVSSEQRDFPRQMANDGDPSTCWRPTSEDGAPWWQIDMENRYEVRRISLNLGGTRCHIRLDVSDDGQSWQPIYRNRFARQFQNKTLQKLQGRGRYLRLTADTAKLAVIKIEAFVE